MVERTITFYCEVCGATIMNATRSTRCSVCGGYEMPMYDSVLKEFEQYLKDRINPSMSCANCVDGPGDVCTKNLYRYKDKDFCRHWKLSHKWEIGKEVIKKQLLEQKQRSYE